MKTYIYGEVFIKTKKNLYLINYYNVGFENKITNDFYIVVKGFSSQLGKTNSFTFADGNEHISELRKEEKPLFNRIKEGTRLYKALRKRIDF